MIVKCEKCEISFQLDESRIKAKGTKVRCSRCRYEFKVYPPEKEEVTQTIEISTPVEIEPVRSSSHIKAVRVTPTQFGFSDGDATPMPESVRQKLQAKKAKKPPSSETEAEILSPQSSAIITQPDDEKTRMSPFVARIMRIVAKVMPSFRIKLWWFAIILISFIGVIVVPIEAYRPWQELYQMIERTKNMIVGITSSIPSSELAKMNQFALTTAINRKDRPFYNKPDYRIYAAVAFNMVILDELLPKEKEVVKKIQYIKEFEEDFDYEKLEAYYDYWEERFNSEPDIKQIFKRAKQTLISAKENAKKADFKLNQIQIMLDKGSKENIFKNSIVYVLDSAKWQEEPPSCSGELYEVKEDGEFWRDLALNHQEGYDHNPVFDKDNWYLPRFDVDSYGTWFSVWLTSKTDNFFNTFNIDFSADGVHQAFLLVSRTVIGFILILAVLVAGITTIFSWMLTTPITELTKGAKEVAGGNYDYRVPIFQPDELGEFTRQFNEMTKGQKERLNLMETLEKFLSKELAEIAATEGLKLGGESLDCTIMFTDFAGFSTITQHLNAGGVVEALNIYFDAMIPIIKKYGGFPDKYIGDAIVAIFGAPVRLTDHAERAVLASIEMQKKMREINVKRRTEGKPYFEMRIGLNSGEVIAGAIGCDMKLEYTAIGETTNLANRMESACKISHIMMAEGTYRKISKIFFPGVYIAVTPEPVHVKGYNEPVSGYRIYVDNMSVGKDMNAKNYDAFYKYETTDYKIRYRPEEVRGTKFTSVAKFRES